MKHSFPTRRSSDLTNDYNGPGNVNQAQPFGRGTPYIDGRPVIELVDQPVNDIALIGGTILWAGTYPAIMGVEMRSVYRCRCEGTVIRSETQPVRSEEHTSELPSLMRISYSD